MIPHHQFLGQNNKQLWATHYVHFSPFVNYLSDEVKENNEHLHILYAAKTMEK